MSTQQEPVDSERVAEEAQSSIRAVCPNCGAALEEIRAKFHCPRCRFICETCCEGGR